LQNPLKQRRRGGNYDGGEGDQDAYENSTCPIIAITQHNENFSHRDKANNDYRAKFYSPQSFYGLLREYLILPGISQHLERLIERHEKRDGRYIRIRQKRIFEVNLKERGVRVPALDVRLPKHQGKSADADEHNDHLKKYRASFHAYTP